MKKVFSLFINFFACFLKINNKKIIFESGRDRVDDNPYALFEYLKKHNKKGYKYVYMVSKKTDISMLKRGEYSYYRTLRGYYELATAKLFIKSQSTTSLLKKRKGQIYIYVDHGVLGLKKCGYDIKNEKNMPPLKFVKDFDYYVGQSKHGVDLFKSSSGYNGKVLICGNARTDKLVNLDYDKIKKLKDRLGLKDENKKVVLYTPTFRDWEVENNIVSYKINKIAEIENIYFVVTVHPLAKNLMKQYKLDPRIINAIDYPDMNELLEIADVLITDYSSSIFDFALLQRIAVFYPYDYDEYVEKRGNFYLDYKKDLPGPICYNEDELYNTIKNIDEISEKYKEKMMKFNKKYNEKCDGNSCKRLFEEIDKILNL